jgi:hypothetical protein
LFFEASGLRQNEFCRNQGLALSTLQRQLKKRRLDKVEAKEGRRFVAVKLAGREPNGNSLSSFEVKAWGSPNSRVTKGHSLKLNSNKGTKNDMGVCPSLLFAKMGNPSRFTLRTHNEWPGKIDRLG